MHTYVAHSRDDGEYQTLEEHLSETARLAGAFAAVFGAGEWGELMGRYHDIGKSSAKGQARIKGELNHRVDHSTAGAREVARYSFGPFAAYGVAGHHGGLADVGSSVDLSDTSSLQGRLKRKKIEPYDAAAAGPAPTAPPQMPIAPGEASGMWATLFTRMLASCLIDADRLDTERYCQHGQVNRGGYDDIATLHDRMQAHVQGFGAPDKPINEKRTEIRIAAEAVAESPPGLFSLTVPTGGGKTLTSLSFALAHAKKHGLRRIIYVIPYITITEQNAAVFRDAVGSANVVEHHANFTYDDENEEHARHQLATENWDAPIIVTTSVQFFESLFAAKTSPLRKLHNIAGSVIIFDEAQMIPLPYLLPCIEAIAELVRHFGCTAVLMSATQPALSPYFAQKNMAVREIAPDPKALHAFFRRTTLRDAGTLSEEALSERLAGHTQVLCIVNTRKRAQALYASLPKEGSYHLSTLMYPAHRKAVLEEVRKRLKVGLPCRVVSTSLIEAGVDVSFPVAYRELAGLDSIIQAAGRCNREGKESREKSFVYVFRVEGSNRPPPAMNNAIVAANLVLQAYDDPASLEAIERYFQDVYTLKGKGLDEKGILQMLPDNPLDYVSYPAIERAFRLIESNTQAIIIATDPEAAPLVAQLRAGNQTRDLFRRLGQYTVNVYDDHMRRLYAAGALEKVSDDSWLMTVSKQYDPQMGLNLDVETGLGIFS